ncbi:MULTISPECIES: HNH endonuclease [unclassified Lactococcus]|uniref:HNH endonuclease n=1 Tax=unclassified Lactococcus TaxID=2643510 RepID=UPI0011C810CE|nr:MULTISPECIES: HNH endonuclease [unclassified Lactococcus]MQW23960.1 hypothetical protein [Lactococcus sp. dk101]TXK36977.1 HNH endonuclease [Lactococcus sp. dk310]TXK47602.1 HNH endonuclease [Lactococcus sp. dk322]
MKFNPQWKRFNVIGSQNQYAASNNGEIYFAKKTSNDWEKKAIKKGKNGYYTTVIKKKRYYIHRLIADVFISNFKNTKDKNGDIRNTVDHIDGDKGNNNANNLEWVSQLENNRRYINGKNIIQPTNQLIN